MNYRPDHKLDCPLRKELIKIINSSRGRNHTDRLLDIIRTHPEWHNELIDIYLANEEPCSRRIVWAIDLYSIENPGIIETHLERIVDLLPLFNHDALRRHSLHILSRFPVPALCLGSLLGLCFEWLLSPVQPPAVKVYCMEILYTISLDEPELRKELADCIEYRLNEETPGFKNRGLKILKKLSIPLGKNS
ncbi:MAG: hypothetical protein NTU51_06505 [Bacteroidetes bacterium]|nr:hypothetical protein [Bacteroidota bacterium]